MDRTTKRPRFLHVPAGAPTGELGTAIYESLTSSTYDDTRCRMDKAEADFILAALNEAWKAGQENGYHQEGGSLLESGPTPEEAPALCALLAEIERLTKEAHVHA